MKGVQTFRELFAPDMQVEVDVDAALRAVVGVIVIAEVC